MRDAGFSVTKLTRHAAQVTGAARVAWAWERGGQGEKRRRVLRNIFFCVTK